MPRSLMKPIPASRLVPANKRLSNIKLWLRDTLVLLREFWFTLVLFITTILLGGWLWMIFSQQFDVVPEGYWASVYRVLTLIFFQGGEGFPGDWQRELFFFLMPILGLAIIAPRIAELGILLFNRETRHAEWEVAVATSFNNHIIVCGLGHVGIRVVRELVSLGKQEIAVIERDADREGEVDLASDPERSPTSVRVEECRNAGIPVIAGDALNPDVLHDAGLHQAEALIVCTADDLANLQIALMARKHNPDIRLVIRMWGETFARQLAEQLGLGNVYSASALAAPSFAAAALGTEILQSFYVGTEVMTMSRMVIDDGSELCDMTVTEAEGRYDVSIVMLGRNDTTDVHPEPDAALKAEDWIVVFSNKEGLRRVRTASEPSQRR